MYDKIRDLGRYDILGYTSCGDIQIRMMRFADVWDIVRYEIKGDTRY